MTTRVWGAVVKVHNFLIFLFAMTGGFAASGIAANTYRLVARKPETGGSKAAYYVVMVVAGPSVLFDNAARSWRKKACSALAFWLAAALSAYWSFIIGLFGLSIALAI
ncbi:MAG: hypothetical protein JSR55_09450 [Proteobacteria bacterium]|nr:hypothetical protein [Pseudomonadota bacterium]